MPCLAIAAHSYPLAGLRCCKSVWLYFQVTAFWPVPPSPAIGRNGQRRHKANDHLFGDSCPFGQASYFASGCPMTVLERYALPGTCSAEIAHQNQFCRLCKGMFLGILSIIGICQWSGYRLRFGIRLGLQLPFCAPSHYQHWSCSPVTTGLGLISHHGPAQYRSCRACRRRR